MLAYPQSPSDSMAQLVPCSAAFNSSAMPTLADFGNQQLNSALELDVTAAPAAWADGQTVPSSPTLSTWNYSPQSYWHEATVKSEPVVNYVDSPLEELLEDFTYYGDFQELKPTTKQEEGHALLRQCLSVDDYQQRCHLQFLNQIGSAIASTPQQEMSIKPETKYWNNSAQVGLASVLSLLMEEVNEEVRSTCEMLGVAPNPSQWTVDEVRKWLLWTSQKCALGPIPLERFNMEGAKLTSLTEEEFRNIAPRGGDTLFAKLDIWRSAWNQRSKPQQAPIPSIQVDEPDMTEQLFNWINTTQDLQQQQQQIQQTSSMLSVGQHLLAVPSPASTSSQHGALSPYSDHTHSGSEDLASGLEETDDEEEGREPRAGSSASSRASQATPTGSHIHLWQFLKELLSQPAVHGHAIRWLDRQRGVFKIEDSVRVAKLWGKRKNRPAMNYDKLSRSIRQYYRKGIMKKTERSQRLVYQFCTPYAL